MFFLSIAAGWYVFSHVNDSSPPGPIFPTSAWNNCACPSFLFPEEDHFDGFLKRYKEVKSWSTGRFSGCLGEELLNLQCLELRCLHITHDNFRHQLYYLGPRGSQGPARDRYSSKWTRGYFESFRQGLPECLFYTTVEDNHPGSYASQLILPILLK